MTDHRSRSLVAHRPGPFEPRTEDGTTFGTATSSVLARTTAAVLAAYVALTAVWVLLGFAVTDGPLGALRGLDDRLANDLAARRTARLDDFAYVVAHLADTWIKVGATALLALAFWLAWRRWHEAAVLAVSLIVEAAVFITVTTIVQRPRPAVPQLEQSPVSSSFPSGHTAAAAVYAALAVVVFWHTRSRGWRSLAVVLSLLAPMAIGTARVYQGMHHLSDVVGGAALGFVTVAVVAAIVGRPGDQAPHASRSWVNRKLLPDGSRNEESMP